MSADPHALSNGVSALRTVGAVARLFLAERERWALWLPVALGAGAGFYFQLRFEPSVWLGATALALCLTITIALRRTPAAVLIGLAVATVALGFTAAQVRTVLVSAPILQREIGPVRVLGRVDQVEVRPDDRRLTLSALSIEGLAPEATPARVRVTLRSRDGDLGPNQQVALRAVLLPPSPPAAPGAFDFARDAFFDRIGGVGYAVSAATVLEAAAPQFGGGIAVLRHRLSARIHAVLDGPFGGQVGSVAAALTTGERAGIDEATWNALRDSGLAHIISISGLHFALIAGILFFVVRAGLALVEPIALRFPIKKWAAAIALAGSFGYFLLAGASAPTERSFLMLAIAMLAILLDRRPFSMRMVGWAAAVVVLVAPDSVLGPSFQMSFAAVVALVAAYELLRDPAARWGRGAGPLRKTVLYLAGIAFSSLVAGIATAPYALFHFDRFATHSLVANLVAVPITGLWIMPWALASFVLMPLGLERFGLLPMGWGVEWMLEVGRTVASWPGAAIALPAMPAIGLFAVTIGGIWLCLWQTRWRLLGIPFVLAGLATTWVAPRPDVLISDDAGYMAVRAEGGGMWVSSARSNFTTDMWLRREGLEQGQRWPAIGSASADGRLRCDRWSCLYRADGRLVALVQNEQALAEDCRAADVVVAAVAVFVPCPTRVVIDRLDAWREGAHALWIRGSDIRVESVADKRGQRPWVLPRPAPR